MASVSDARERRLRNLPLVLTISAIALAVIMGGALQTPHPYGHPEFVVDVFAPELVASAFLAAATALLFPWRAIGWRWPSSGPIAGIVPLIVLAVVGLGCWLAARATLPSGAEAMAGRSLLILRTTLLVGLNEEWIFRGLVLATLCLRLGLRRGALLAALVFGLFHTLNAFAGEALEVALIQAASTLLIGAVFVRAAIATRSLLWPVLAHALHDFVVLDLARFAAAGAHAAPVLVVTLTAWTLGVICLVQLFRLEGEPPYEQP